MTALLITCPTALQFKPPPNTKACLYTGANSFDHISMNAVGFYGG